MENILIRIYCKCKVIIASFLVLEKSKNEKLKIKPNRREYY